MIIVLLGPPSPLMTQTIEALGFLLAALVGGTENAMRPPGPGTIAAQEPFAVYGVNNASHGFFIPHQYLQNYADLSAAMGTDASKALWHFYRAGWREGRTFLPTDGPKLEHTIVAAEAPETELVSEWRDAKAVTAVVLDDPIATARHIRATAGITERKALARVTRSFAIAEDWLLAERRPLVARSSQRQDAVIAGLESIATACGLANTRPWFEYYFREHAGGAHEPAPTAEAGASDDALTKAVLSGYAKLLDGGRVDAVTWPAAAFSKADANSENADADIAMEGPARWLAYGPYMHLPNGRWISESVFAAAKNFNGCKFAADMYQQGPVDKVLAGHKFVLPEEGVFSLSFDFDTLDPRAPIENRFQTEEGLIGGTFRLHETRLRRV